jgi:hypothetical protein
MQLISINSDNVSSDWPNTFPAATWHLQNKPFLRGYLVPSHELEKRHYYSCILKFAIAILNFPQICHRRRMKTTGAQLQVYTKTYISSYLRSSLNDMRVPLCQHPLHHPIFCLPFSFLFSRAAGQAARARRHGSTTSGGPEILGARGEFLNGPLV